MVTEILNCPPHLTQVWPMLPGGTLLPHWIVGSSACWTSTQLVPAVGVSEKLYLQARISTSSTSSTSRTSTYCAILRSSPPPICSVCVASTFLLV